MRSFFVFASALLLALSASAATLQVEVDRQGFTGPIQVAVAPRVDGKPPEWSSPRSLKADKAAVSFDGLADGLYAVMVSGPQPLQRLSAKANLGTNGATLRLVIPRSRTVLRATMAGKPLPGAGIGFTHDALRWHTSVVTDEDGSFAGELWEPGVYSASVTRTRASAPHSVEVSLSHKPLTIDVPDRHVTGRVLAGGKPLAGAVLNLRSENSISTLNVRAQTDAEGRFEYFGVREGALSLTARAPSYLDSDAVAFELHGAPAQKSVDLELTRGEPRTVRVVDAHEDPLAGATLIASCNGHVKSTAVTNAKGVADVALPAGSSCSVYALPQEGSFAVAAVDGSKPLIVRVPDGASSLRLALQSVAGEPFPAMSLLMRVDGVAVPPSVSRVIASRGMSLITNEDGSLALRRIPKGTYEFWPYRTSAEGQMIYETAMEFAAPISVTVEAGENNAIVKFKAR
jgi:hypothetical protein